tara:strand:+ start:106 stop:636 length:531 start_codon:yes stop_codon:yes gene_type:complete
MSQITFENNAEELKFIQVELNQLIEEYEKTYKIYIKKIKNKKGDTKPDLQKLDELNETIKILVNKVKSMLPNFKNTQNINRSIFSRIKGEIDEPWKELNNKKEKINEINNEINNLVNKNNDEKINNKSISTKYFLVTIFVVIIIFLTYKAFIYMETNNIDLIILTSIVFLIIYRFI